MRLMAEVLLEKEKAKTKELRAVINRLSMIQSEIFGAYDGIYMEELNYLLMKKKIKKFDYSD